ncbi:MAG: hypothetical protein IJ806_00885 [Ruminococcus sp.]|nr:hypothetical protein [Ruminococcus sp.]
MEKVKTRTKAEMRADEIRSNTLDYISKHTDMQKFVIMFEPINRHLHNDIDTMPKATLTISIGKSHNTETFETYLTAATEKPSVMWGRVHKEPTLTFYSHLTDHRELMTTLNLTYIADITIDNYSTDNKVNYLITVKTNTFDYLIKYRYIRKSNNE